jgi:hypothetical protein
VQLREPSNHTVSKSTALPASGSSPPPTDWVQRTWHVTSSTLPLWKGKVNVKLTYNPLPLPSASGDKTPDLDDLVEYQKSPKSKVSTVKGVSSSTKTSSLDYGWAFDWRGKGLLAIASSKWEVLGWGEEASGNMWLVSFFGKTLFTPAGIDVLSSSPSGPSEDTLNNIKQQLAQFHSAKDLAETLFKVPAVEPSAASKSDVVTG